MRSGRAAGSRSGVEAPQYSVQHCGGCEEPLHQHGGLAEKLARFVPQVTRWSFDGVRRTPHCAQRMTGYSTATNSLACELPLGFGRLDFFDVDPIGRIASRVAGGAVVGLLAFAASHL